MPLIELLEHECNVASAMPMQRISSVLWLYWPRTEHRDTNCTISRQPEPKNARERYLDR